MAQETGQEMMEVSGAHDIWALGLIAYELLTGTRVFEAHHSSTATFSDSADEQVRLQLIGEAGLPWEDARTRSSVRKLHQMKRSVMLCLSRNPKERPNSELLLDMWNEIFEGMAGTTADTSRSPASAAQPVRC
jgi:serine/threonine protein kinase